MNINQLRWAGLAMLLVIMAALGWWMVPAHWTSIWMDREFTDWISPIANRLHDGSRLYDEGLHSPMPPLPYVLLRLLFPHGAIWIQENLLNFAFQAATLLLLYCAFSRCISVGVAFVCTLAAIPVFFALPKTILYDSMAQSLVAASAVVAARLINIHTTSPARSQPPTDGLMLVLEGVVLGLLMLTKQSTGAGTVFGVCLVLLLLPAAFDLRRRCLNIFSVLFFMGMTVGIVSLALCKFISFQGMIQDVFIIGSEPKGGSRAILGLGLVHLRHYLGLTAIAALIFSALSWWLYRTQTWRNRFRLLEPIFTPPVDLRIPVASHIWLMTAAFATAIGSCVVFYHVGDIHTAVVPYFAINKFRWLVLNLGLVASVFLAVAVIYLCARQLGSGVRNHPLAPYALIFLPAALFHNLSSAEFRWSYDNNPLIVLALALVLTPLLTGRGVEGFCGGKWAFPMRVSLLCICMVAVWHHLGEQLTFVRQCTEPWPEIRHLAGARLRPEAAGMRTLVNTVQTLASQPPDDTVLLLPNDPNVEAWFDRPRPAFSSAIIFPDQYWDRYVDRDFAGLQARPPRIIVIGPRNYWRDFSQHWKLHLGAERLIDLVKDKLLPENYELRSQQPIGFRGGEDHMDVYVRRSQATAPVAKQ